MSPAAAAKKKKTAPRSSKRTLVQKLGIKRKTAIIIMNPPRGYRDVLGPLPTDTVLRRDLKGPFDLIHFFADRRSELKAVFPRLARELSRSGALWISWPKGASGVKTDLSENLVRQLAIENGLVDVKVCAIDDIWSGLKLVYRLKGR